MGLRVFTHDCDAALQPRSEFGVRTGIKTAALTRRERTKMKSYITFVRPKVTVTQKKFLHIFQPTKREKGKNWGKKGEKGYNWTWTPDAENERNARSRN